MDDVREHLRHHAGPTVDVRDRVENVVGTVRVQAAEGCSLEVERILFDGNSLTICVATPPPVARGHAAAPGPDGWRFLGSPLSDQRFQIMLAAALRHGSLLGRALGDAERVAEGATQREHRLGSGTEACGS